jgi:hypothetical protein
VSDVRTPACEFIPNRKDLLIKQTIRGDKKHSCGLQAARARLLSCSGGFAVAFYQILRALE